MFLLFLFLLVPFLIYALRVGLGKSNDVTKAVEVSRIVYLVFLVLFLFLLFLEKKNYFLAGYRSTSIAYLIVTVSAITYILLDRRPILHSFKRTLLHLIAIILMIGSAFLILEMVDDYKKQLVYSDSKFRLEFTARGLMSPCGLPLLFVKNGIVERKCQIITNDTCILKENISSVRIKQTGSTFFVTYLLNDDSTEIVSHPLTVQYKKL